MSFSNFTLFLRLTWLKLVRRLGLGCTGSVFYIGGPETLPPPLSAEEEHSKIVS